MDLPFFRQRMREARKMQGITQEEVAVKAGITQAAMSAFELGSRTPSLAQFVAIADALRVDADLLLGRRDWAPDLGESHGKSHRRRRVSE